jgi:hypothetical protein
VEPLGYADDMGVMGSRAAVENAVIVTSTYCHLTNQALNATKSEFFVVADRHPTPLLLDGRVLQPRTSLKCLGASLNLTGESHAGALVQQRVDSAIAAAKRIAALPLPFQVRARMLAAQPCAQAFYGVEVCPWSEKHLLSMQAASLQALWRSDRRNLKWCSPS